MSERPNPAGILIRPLGDGDQALISHFSCGDADLDDFIKSDAARYQDLNVARTYLAFHGTRLVGYITLAADAIRLTSSERKKLKGTNGNALGHNDHPVIPATKLARIGVCCAFKKEVKGCGTSLVRAACLFAIATSESQGCRLLTLDAYPDAVDFYQKLGFVLNKDKTGQKPSSKPAKVTHPSMRRDLFNPETPPWMSGVILERREAQPDRKT